MKAPLNRTLFILLLVLALASTPSCALLAGIEDFTYVARDASIIEEAGGDGLDAGPLDGGDLADTGSDVTSDAATDGGCPCLLPNQTCVQNECFPQVVASGLQGPQTIVTAGNFVVWAENGTTAGAGRIRACPLAGCASTGPVVVSSNLAVPALRRAGPDGLPVMFESGRSGVFGTPVKRVRDDLSLDTVAPAHVPNVVGATATATSVVFGTATNTYSCTTSSCTPSDLTQSGGTGRAVMIVDNTVYLSPQNAGLVACDLPVCQAPITFLAGEDVRDVHGDTNATYAVVAGKLAVWVIPSSSAKADSVAVPAQPRSLAVAKDFVYVVAANSGIYALDRATKTVVPKYLGGDPLEITFAGAFLYWTDKDGTVLRAPR